MQREAWFCPACQRHHAPHVDTCPGVTAAPPLPTTTILPYPLPSLTPIVTPTPLDGWWQRPMVSVSDGTTVAPDPSIVCIN